MPRNETAPYSVHQILFSSVPEVSPPPAALALSDLAGRARYNLWTLEAARAFMLTEFGSSLVRALDSLKAYAYKADLARYCILYIKGGLYVDLSVTDVVLFPTGHKDFIAFRDRNSDNTSWRVANSFFYAKAGCPILEACISQVEHNVKTHHYGRDPLSPTGPTLFGRAVAQHGPSLDILIGQLWWLRWRRSKFTLPGIGVVGRGKVGGKHLGGQSGVAGGNNYNDLWNSRDIYAASVD